MSRPEKFSTASAEELSRLFANGRPMRVGDFIREVIIPEVAREVREECGGDLQEAKRWLEEARNAERDNFRRAEAAERERDGFKAWVERAEAALAAERAKTADAKRQGFVDGWHDVLIRAKNIGALVDPPHGQPIRGVHWSVGGVKAREAARLFYAPPAPAGVRIGEHVVEYVSGDTLMPFKVSSTHGHRVFANLRNAINSLPTLPTADEYAALLRLADREGKGNG